MATIHKQLVIERTPSRRVQLFDASEASGQNAPTPYYRLRLGEADLPTLAAKLAADDSEITDLLLADGNDRPLTDEMYEEEVEQLRRALVSGGAETFRELMGSFSPEWKLVSFEVRDPDWSVYQVRRGGAVEVITDRGESRLIDAVQRFLRAK